MSRMGDSPVRISMNELSNHDHSRFLTRTNRTVGRTDSRGPKAAEMNVNKGVFKEAVVVQMTWPGAPTIYYGDEAGVCGWTDPDNRRTYPWGHEDKELIEFHKAVINIHKSVPALIDGSYKIFLANIMLLHTAGLREAVRLLQSLIIMNMRNRLIFRYGNVKYLTEAL